MVGGMLNRGGGCLIESARTAWLFDTDLWWMLYVFFQMGVMIGMIRVNNTIMRIRIVGEEEMEMMMMRCLRLAVVVNHRNVSVLWIRHLAFGFGGVGF